MSEYLFTSQSVSVGDPGKVADQVSDAILDAILAQDPTARVAAETLVNTGLCILAGEVSTTAQVDYIKVAREAIARIASLRHSIAGEAPDLAPVSVVLREMRQLV